MIRMYKIPFKLAISIDNLIYKCNFIQCTLDILSVQGDTGDDNVLKPYSSEDTDMFHGGNKIDFQYVLIHCL